MASKSYGWDVRNTVKISPKMVKKGHFSTSEGKRPKPTPLPHMRLWFKHSIRENLILSSFFPREQSVTIVQSLSPVEGEQWIA